MPETPTERCPRCNGEMKPGKAIDQTWTGTPEWEGDTIFTMSPGGQGKLIDCMKCEKCGWSRRMGGIDIVEKLRSFDSDYDMHYLNDAADEIERLRGQVRALQHGEFICTKCGIRKNSDTPQPDF